MFSTGIHKHTSHLLHLGICPSNAILLRQMICWHLRRSRPEKILNGIPANTPPVFSSLRPRIWQRLLRLATKDYSDRLLPHASCGLGLLGSDHTIQPPRSEKFLCRMLKKPAGGVLASLRDSTYRSVRLASSLAAALLDSLFEHPVDYSCGITIRGVQQSILQKPMRFASEIKGNLSSAVAFSV